MTVYRLLLFFHDAIFRLPNSPFYLMKQDIISLFVRGLHFSSKYLCCCFAAVNVSILIYLEVVVRYSWVFNFQRIIWKAWSCFFSISSTVWNFSRLWLTLNLGKNPNLTACTDMFFFFDEHMRNTRFMMNYTSFFAMTDEFNGALMF